MRVLVTGAGGFIGRTLANTLRERGDEVIGLDLIAGPNIVAGNVAEAGPWQDSFDSVDLVIHTAALVSNVPTLDEAWRVNVVGTRNVLDAAVRAGVQRFVHFSSIRAFSDLGFPDGVTEHHPVRPDGNPYVDTRVASEQVVLQAHSAGEIAATIVRPGDVYGPGSRPWTVLPIQLIKQNLFVLPAMGNGIFSPIYIDDLVAGVLLAADSPAAIGQVFTISGGIGITTKEFFAHYYRMLHKRGPVVVPTSVAIALSTGSAQLSKFTSINAELSPVSVKYLCRTGTYSIDKARQMLGFEPKIDLETGMALTRKWLASEGMI
ncbi:NAD-dependent epimerase/dehydratase family protein [Smaragdicoccus niigatensis]|uniref:NAD-dependent epimerase/dehydratase family protein n=1 Tax=Smaragdicoccus niigatensis TaxID=359359 RepID=UPI000366563B|nr:NAD-dependent epimerase/dehydratase family protein [Smaragdicoccus niigatensis]